jgi:hypothetical protein
VDEVGRETIKTKRLAGEDSARVEAKVFNQTLQVEGKLTMLRFVLQMAGLGAVNGSVFRKAKRAAN